jgi:HD-like signal output (HDOD) protein
MNAARPQVPRSDRGSYALSGSGERTATVDPQLLALFEATFNAPDYQPPLLPATAIELMDITRRADVTFATVAGLLEREPLIAGQVLRIAQSPVYRRSTPIRSLEQAASLLGLRALGDLFLQAALTARVFRAAAYEQPMNQLREHAVATAIISRLVSRETRHSDDYAFLCGLLHDVGTAACIIVLSDAFESGVHKGAPIALPVLWPIVRDMHEAMSLRLAELWDLPPGVRVVIGHHHALRVNGMVNPLAAIVCIADALAAELGHSLESEVDEERVAVAREALSLTDGQLLSVRHDAERILAFC